jgi:hypothetical protein
VTLFSRLFSKNADDFLAKGDRLLEEQRYFEARCAYEDGLQRHLNRQGAAAKDDVADAFASKIAKANLSLAEMNIHEAKFAISRGAYAKAAEHLELAKTLTDDSTLREKAEKLHAGIVENTNETSKLEPTAGGCSSCSSMEPQTQAIPQCEDPDLSPLDYYDLLIRQLPGEMYSRYAGLGEKFAYMYLAASRDEHKQALEMLEDWYEGSFSDIYLYEKGMILHRLGYTAESEDCLKGAISENAANPLAHLGLALLMIEGGRLNEAAVRLDAMIADGMLAEQAILLRGDTAQMAGDLNGSIDYYGMLLSTTYARPAAERLHAVLMQCDRQQEAANVYKRYLTGCKH